MMVRKRSMGLTALAIACAFMMLLAATASAQQRLVVLWPTYTQEKIEFGEYLVESFKEKYPDVEVELLFEYNRLPVMIAAGMPPDVTWQGAAGYANASEGWFLDLSEYVARDAEEFQVDDFFPAIWQHTEYQGMRWGIPLSVNLGIYYYNQRMFDERGLAYPTMDWDADDLVDAAKRLTRDINGDGNLDIYGLSLELTAPTWFFSYGGPILSEDGTRSLFDNPLRRAALEFYYNVQNIHGIAPPTSVLRTYARSNSSPVMFANEHLGITFGGIAGTMGTLRASADFMWDISSWPWIEAGGQRVRASTYTPESLVIPATAANPDMAWEFIKHALSVDTYSEVTRRGHVFPVRRSVMASDAWINPELLPRNNQAFVDSLDVALPHIASIHATGSEMNTSTGAIANSYVSGAITLSEAIENIDRVIRNLIGQ